MENEQEMMDRGEVLGIPEHVDGRALMEEAAAEMPRLLEEERAWQEQYNRPRALETQETETTEQATEQTELEEQETWTTPRHRPGL